MTSPTRELTRLKQAAKASSVASAHASLERLRKLFRRDRASFTPRIIAQIKQYSDRLPARGPTMICPSCQGAGKMRWMKSYKHTCTRCGGWRRVEKTAEVRRPCKGREYGVPSTQYPNAVQPKVGIRML